MNQPPLEPTAGDTGEESPVRLLLLDDEPVNLHLRSAVLRRHGYLCYPASTFDEAAELFDQIDIAVLDYHLGEGRFGSEVAVQLRRHRPEVPIIIVSATLERYFGGPEDLRLLKGYSSNDDLLAALSSLKAKIRGARVVVDGDDFFYSRISLSIGSDILVQIFDEQCRWVYCNDAAAEALGQEREWFPGRSLDEHPFHPLRRWKDVLDFVTTQRESYIDRTRHGLLGGRISAETDPTWSILAYPITLQNGLPGAVLTARVLERSALPT